MAEQRDWRTLHSGMELDRIVAELLGWTEIEQREIYYENFDGTGVAPALVGVKNGTRYEIPGFSVNAHDAISLLEEIYNGGRNEVFLQPGLGGWYVCLNGKWIVTMADTAAWAIVSAWLQWKESQP